MVWQFFIPSYAERLPVAGFLYVIAGRGYRGKEANMAYKILIIDDDIGLLKMLKKYFEIKKYEIITAENGSEGLSKLKLKPDIILLDVNMPDIDGIEVCRRIRDKKTGFMRKSADLMQRATAGGLQS